MENILTIDVESWIHFSEALDGNGLNRASLDKKALDGGHLEFALERLLDLLSRSGSRATFFVLGELMEWDLDIVKEIRERGHEIGYHGHDHRIIDTPETLESQLSLSRDFMEEFRPVGFRAPQLYLLPSAMEILKRSGFLYSSSSYGPFENNLQIGGTREIPVSTWPWRNRSMEPRGLPRPLSPSILKTEIPFGSGMGAGLLGEATSFFIRKSNRKKQPAVIMLHPWQIYPPKKMTAFNFKLKIALKHPLFLPYAFSRARSLRKLIQTREFTSFSGYLKLAPRHNRQ